jgi:lysophospholipase L1-like esterase
MKKNIIVLGISLIFSILILEIFLHIYNPIAPRIQGNKIILPINKVYSIRNDKLSRLDKEITHTRNGLGFRGNEPPEDLNSIPSIICIGGSTTECYYLNDGQDWPAQVFNSLKDSIPNLWINNAGLDGHSTWGHSILLKQHIFKLKPRFVLMLCGINDVGREDISDYDTRQIKQDDNSVPSIRDWFIGTSQILTTIRTIRMSMQASKQGVSHTDLDLNDLEKIEVAEYQIDSIISSHKKLVDLYGNRLENIINDCKNNQIQLILMTQPMLWGNGIDPRTGLELSNLKINDYLNSKIQWQLMEIYNVKAKMIAEKFEIPVIDLANKLEKNSEYLRWDPFHSVRLETNC